MNILIWLIIGGVVGWLASLIMRTDGQQGIFLNIVVGIIGAFVGGLLLSPLFGYRHHQQLRAHHRHVPGVAGWCGDPAGAGQPVPPRAGAR